MCTARLPRPWHFRIRELTAELLVLDKLPEELCPLMEKKALDLRFVSSFKVVKLSILTSADSLRLSLRVIRRLGRPTYYHPDSPRARLLVRLTYYHPDSPRLRLSLRLPVRGITSRRLGWLTIITTAGRPLPQVRLAGRRRGITSTSRRLGRLTIITTAGRPLRPLAVVLVRRRVLRRLGYGIAPTRTLSWQPRGRAPMSFGRYLIASL